MNNRSNMQVKPCFSCFLLMCMFASAMSTDPNQRCNEPKNEGEGQKHELRYFFDGNVCTPFFYKGEGGNSNNFDSDQNCTIACLPDQAHQKYPEADAVCSLPVDNGACFAMHLKYYFDTEEKICRLFHYGGCQGNGNRFDTKEECQQTCRGKSGRSLGQGPDINPDETPVSAGLVVGVLGGVVFAVAIFAAVALYVTQKKGKARKRVPTTEMSEM
ncbi:hypothetical protein AALO_G00288080 [Alosa alosa]|uniref:BPTI/Kunitz inhibitor domain-containing protein n=1 Tax=Alosa alosa TaxID=278164 RepID=A0AAV6FG39_9TELE|nr:kunitz-type serine protease inhibitor bitisilin-3 [Alosa alosa]KAG5261764.1 hypothetical protein AALO_G00288080 [Alosa alosa]